MDLTEVLRYSIRLDAILCSPWTYVLLYVALIPILGVRFARMVTADNDPILDSMDVFSLLVPGILALVFGPLILSGAWLLVQLRLLGMALFPEYREYRRRKKEN